jgi:catechol 2,3-dioxygenase
MPGRFIAHLAHVELITPSLETSVAFYKDVMGLEESGRDEKSVYLRCWGEWSYHSLQLTEGKEPALAHAAWRMQSPAALEAAVAQVEAAGTGIGWQDATKGHGPAYRLHGPGGHVHELFWEIDSYEPPEALRSPFPSRPQRFIPRGVAPRQVDHVTVMTADPVGDAKWYRDVLGFVFTEWTELDDHDLAVFATVTNNEKSHDLGLVLDQSEVPGRLHHMAWWVDSREELLRAADILLNAGVDIEFGPGRHGLGEQDYLYAREPGGCRIEINTGGYRLYVPDWEPKRWVPSQGSNTMYKNVDMPDSMMEGFPSTKADDLEAEDAVNPWASPGVR